MSPRNLCVVLCAVCLTGAHGAGAQNPPITIGVDAAANRHTISPYIYGVAHANTATLKDLNSPLNRWGGNSTTRYNWQQNADNRAADWFFESIAYPSAVAGEGPDTFIANSKAAGAQAMMTIPLVGWVARLGPGRGKTASFRVSRYGAQQKTDPWWSDAGNGVKPGGGLLAGNDPNDANAPADALFQKEWVKHLVAKWRKASQGGLRYYLLDNEPSIWHATHRDVHPTGATMDEVLSKTLDYAARIKEADSSAKVVGPEEWGWSGYLYSGFDLQYGSLHGWASLPDRKAHDSWDYVPWLLDQLHKNHLRTGKRLLDVFTLHYYPQSGEFGDDTSPAMQRKRNRSTRSLWDPAYKDESWINDRVQLIPRMKGWVKTYYPGTLTGVTEYNWGAENHINGATAQADILGIFGREGLDVAARWLAPSASTPVYKAMKMYRNYDGRKSGFGSISVAATVSNPDEVSAFAAVRSNNSALTLMVVSKVLSGDTPATIALANFPAGSAAQVWQLTAANAITRRADIPLTGSSLAASLPAQSITLFVIPAKPKP